MKLARNPGTLKLGQRVEITHYGLRQYGAIVEINANSHRAKVVRDYDGKSDWYSMADIHGIKE